MAKKGPWAQFQSVKLEKTGSRRGLETKEQFTYHMLVLKQSSPAQEVGGRHHAENQLGSLSVHSSLLSSSEHFIYKWGGTVCG